MRRLAVLLLIGGCDRVLGLTTVGSPVVDSRAPDTSTDAQPFEDCRGFVQFTEAPNLFPGLPTGGSPTITGDFQEAYDIEIDPVSGDADIHRWVRDAAGFAEADASALSSPGIEDDPSITADGLQIAFVSTRTDGIALMYLASRVSTADAWSTPQLMPGLESFVAGGLSLAPDGLTLYAVSGAGDLYQARRPLPGVAFTLEGVKANNIVYPTVAANGLELISEVNPTDTNVGAFEIVRGTNEQVFELPDVSIASDPNEPPLTQANLTPDNHILITGGGRTFVRSCTP